MRALLLFLLACGAADVDVQAPEELVVSVSLGDDVVLDVEAAHEEPVISDSQGAEDPESPRGPTIHQQPGGRCEPMPREGDACNSDVHGFCVVSWGQPGGRSFAYWCRGGRWIGEEETNLP